MFNCVGVGQELWKHIIIMIIQLKMVEAEYENVLIDTYVYDLLFYTHKMAYVYNIPFVI